MEKDEQEYQQTTKSEHETMRDIEALKVRVAELTNEVCLHVGQRVVRYSYRWLPETRIRAPDGGAKRYSWTAGRAV
jgi:hypothetical protein